MTESIESPSDQGNESDFGNQTAVLAQDILDSLAANVCVVDNNGSIVATNASWKEFAQENNYKLSEPEESYSIGLNYLAICHSAFEKQGVETARKIEEGLRNVLEDKIQKFSTEYPCHSPSQKRWFLVTISRLRDTAGGAVISHTDISETYLLKEEAYNNEQEIRRLNSELEERVAERTRDLKLAFEELETFSYTVSHDLRSPLRSINGYTSILLEDYGDSLDAEGKEYIARIQKLVSHSSELIDALVQLAGMSREEMHKERVNLGEIARVVLNDLHRNETDRNVEFKLEGDLVVTGDAGMLTIAMENILGNAWKFSCDSDPCKITVEGHQEDECHVCTITDNGIGFNNRKKESLFIPFQRLVSDREYRGHGIGLATVDRIVRRHGGSISAEGQPGVGASFSLRLPRM